MDEIQEKRNMMQMLLKMLKSSAANEVGAGLKAPEGMPKDAHGIEVEKVSLLPGEHMDGDESPEEASMPEMDKPELPMEKPSMPMESHDDESMEDDEDDMPPSPFMSLMKKKGKK